MKLPVMAAAVLALLSACANQDGSQQANMSQNKQPPSNFQSVGSCEPTGWAGLERDSRKLPPDQRERVMAREDDRLVTPREQVYPVRDAETARRLGVEAGP